MARGSSGSHGSPGTFVTVLTAVALAAVGFFAYQASAAPDGSPLATAPSGEPSPEATDGTGSPDEGAQEELDTDSDETDGEPPLPAESGDGLRVVYALADQRVWLVEPSDDGLGDTVLATYPVYPSSVSPDPGSYLVSSRSEQITGSDGVPIENVVVFDAPSDVVFGFSTATDGSTPDPGSEQRTGGIRQFATDGEDMWEFAPVGTPVIVVP
ncbi:MULTISPECIES: L,D-transpeptidase [unclassified Streptomyces]|uniref:L,D-transpeptidase n=1 Tax=unclassified Streptomyces TaxID=2593676 RepID=UPI0015E1A2AE|nr:MULTISPECIES: L,D-transpeptidase [unclassified Streptomyces]